MVPNVSIQCKVLCKRDSQPSPQTGRRSAGIPPQSIACTQPIRILNKTTQTADYAFALYRAICLDQDKFVDQMWGKACHPVGKHEEAFTRSLAQGLAGSKCSESTVLPHSSTGTLFCQAHHNRRSPTQQACIQLSKHCNKHEHMEARVMPADQFQCSNQM